MFTAVIIHNDGHESRMYGYSTRQEAKNAANQYIAESDTADRFVVITDHS